MNLVAPFQPHDVQMKRCKNVRCATRIARSCALVEFTLVGKHLTIALNSNGALTLAQISRFI
jgi:hypothetical protein